MKEKKLKKTAKQEEKSVVSESRGNNDKKRNLKTESSAAAAGESFGGELKKGKKLFIFVFLFSLVLGGLSFYFLRKIVSSIAIFVVLLFLFLIYTAIKVQLRKTAAMRKIEESFPDFIGLMASNLRAGMTIDRALLLSSRKEFAPLDKEISVLGKDIVTGKDISAALEDAAKRIKSEKISKTIQLIISGIRSGGNLAVLLEETSSNMRERNFVEKRAASNVLMYVIFIFFAVAIGAPLLFGLSSVLVSILTQLVGNLPTEQVVTNVPFALKSISISESFIFYFALIFLVVTDVLASFVLGLVSKGREKEGLKYVLPLILISVSVFFLSRFFLLRYFSDLF